MSILHICNTFFESELAHLSPPTLKKALNQNFIFSQLQFLPLLYMGPDDHLLATKCPPDLSDKINTFEQKIKPTKIDTWGHSLLISTWAKENDISYSIPPWEIIQKVNSKLFSFSQSPLKHSYLLHEEPLPKKPMVLKSCYGTAGRGLILSDHPKALAFCKDQWNRSLPIIVEPFVKRQCDFSTQWHVHKDQSIEYLGATFCHTSPKGKHIANTVTKKDPPQLEKQKEIAQNVLAKMASLGFYGHVGIDAMIYNEDKLQPIVEINGRKTMGYVTLMAARKKNFSSSFTLRYQPKKGKILPEIYLS